LPQEFLEARPSAELLPLSAGEQDDESESEMGLTYDELSTFGVLRKVKILRLANAPSYMYRHLTRARLKNSAPGPATSVSWSSGKTARATALAK
jgi:NH3-dependent NAD+ synthetase